jgi:dihydrofolate reductase
MARNRVIGANNAIPWHLPAELKMFKTITMGHHIVMGRKTWESIGRLLPGRTTVIVTRQSVYAVPGAIVVHSLPSAVETAKGDDEVFVIGGAELFAAALPLANRLYLTVVEADIAGDTYMPDFALSEWHETSAERFGADEKNAYPYRMTVYDRLPASAQYGNL